MSSDQATWWGNFGIDVGARAYWRIGSLELWAERTDHEWRFAERRGGDPMDPTVVVECPSVRTPPETLPDQRRFGFRQSPAEISLTPALAPRPMIVKPEVPFALTARQESTLYVSSPLWIEVATVKPDDALFEVPTHRPSDTWFGASTREGELCFAGRTRARLQLPDEMVITHRAIAAIHIRNRAATLLNLERIKLPTPNLSVFVDGSGQPWTEQVTLDRQEDGDFAALRLGKGPEGDVKGELLRGPRVKAEKGLSIRSFGGIFG